MTEEAKPPTEEKKPAEEKPAPSAPPPEVKAPKGFVIVSEGELQGYRTKGKQLSELEKFKADAEAEKQRLADEALANKGKHEEIIAKREAKITELEQTLAATKHEALVSHAMAQLANDVPSAAARRALAADWAAKPSEEREIEGAFEAFIEAQRKADPATFGTVRKVEHAGGAGNIDAGGGDDLRARLHSTDPEIKRAAAAEEMNLIMKGELQPGWDQH